MWYPGIQKRLLSDDGINPPVYSRNSTVVVFAPIITADPVDVLTTSNSTIEFNCTAVGSPPPLITWYRLESGQDLSDVGTIDNIIALTRDLPDLSSFNVTNSTETSSTSALTIDTVQFADFGDYVCVATLDINNIDFLMSITNSDSNVALQLNSTFTASETASLVGKRCTCAYINKLCSIINYVFGYLLNL